MNKRFQWCFRYRDMRSRTLKASETKLEYRRVKKNSSRMQPYGDSAMISTQVCYISIADTFATIADVTDLPLYTDTYVILFAVDLTNPLNITQSISIYFIALLEY